MNATYNSDINVLDDYTLFELNKINNKSTKMRLINELIELKKKNVYIHVEYIPSNDLNFKTQINNFIVNITIMLENQNDIYNFEITSEYPFRTPKKFTINYKKYLNYLNINSFKTKKDLKLYYGIDCLCCSGINCPTNWVPSLKMETYILEYMKFKKYRYEIILRLLLEKILLKYLCLDINLMEWII